MSISIYTVDEAYVRSLEPIAPHLFHNSKPGQRHSRKFIGVVLEIGGSATSRRSRPSSPSTAR